MGGYQIQKRNSSASARGTVAAIAVVAATMMAIAAIAIAPVVSCHGLVLDSLWDVFD